MAGKKNRCRVCGLETSGFLPLCPACRKGIAKTLLTWIAPLVVLAVVVILWTSRSRTSQAPFESPGSVPPPIDEQATALPHQEIEPAVQMSEPPVVADSQLETEPVVKHDIQQVEETQSAIPDERVITCQNFKDGGDFVTAIGESPVDGSLWFGSEEYGVVKFFEGETIRHTTKSGLGDDNGYALVVDAGDNVWVGTLNHGLSKYHGGEWTTYSILDGLGGLHVYSLALESDGMTIWCGHENGVSRFDGRTWRRFDIADGLPCREITALSIAEDGTVWAGGAIGGIAGFDGETWTRISKEQGLPDDRINGLHASRDGRLWIATANGAACYHPQEGIFELLSAPEEDIFGIDSHVTCVTEDKAGYIWFGTRRAGIIKYDPKQSTWENYTANKDGLPDNYVNAIFIADNGRLWFSVLGYGVCTFAAEAVAVAERTEAEPGAALKPQLEPYEWNPDEFRQRLHNGDETEGQAKDANERAAVYIGEDWQTQGDWMGSYGTYFYVLAGMGYPGDFIGGTGAFSTSYKILVGNNRREQDNVAAWIHWGHTDLPRCLQNPFEEDRRQADWDDRGENYPINHHGPHLYINLALKEQGLYRLALYFVNKDAQELEWKSINGIPGANRQRDYLVEVKEWTPTELDTGPEVWGSYRKQRAWMLSDAEYEGHPVLASCRVRQFAGGVYKRFVVIGPGVYRIRIQRCSSHNTICSGFFLDQWSPANPTEISEKVFGDKANDTIRISHRSLKEISGIAEAEKAVAGLVDLSIFSAMKARTDELDTQNLYLLANICGEIGLSKQRLMFIASIAERMQEFVKRAENREDALAVFHRAAWELWKQYFAKEGAFTRPGGRIDARRRSG